MPNDEPTKLYHYTTLGGLMGILGKDGPNIRASDAQFLNDAKELEFGLDLVQEMLRSAIDSYLDTSPPTLARRDTRLREIRKVTSAFGEYERFSPVHVASFSDNGDLLSQWRAYGSLGYCIEFDRAGLEASTEARDCGGTFGQLRRVLYGKDAREDIQNRFISPLIQAVIDDLDEAPFMGEPGGIALGEMFIWAKHKAFSEENEWRIGIHRPLAEKVKYREHDNGPVAFVDIPIDRSAVTGIVIGPSPQKEVRARAVRQWLHATGYPDAAREVRESTAPYRG